MSDIDHEKAQYVVGADSATHNGMADVVRNLRVQSVPLEEPKNRPRWRFARRFQEACPDLLHPL
jgi:hypothetical protein